MTVEVQGMTCASCVRRVEKALKRVEGVAEASVNLATEQATLSFAAEAIPFGTLQAAVEHAGYHLRPVSAPQQPASASAQDEATQALAALRRAWTVSLAVGLVMMALMYLPLDVPTDVLAPVLLIAASVVQFWAGRSI